MGDHKQESIKRGQAGGFSLKITCMNIMFVCLFVCLSWWLVVGERVLGGGRWVVDGGWWVVSGGG